MPFLYSQEDGEAQHQSRRQRGTENGEGFLVPGRMTAGEAKDKVEGAPAAIKPPHEATDAPPPAPAQQEAGETPPPRKQPGSLLAFLTAKPSTLTNLTIRVLDADTRQELPACLVLSTGGNAYPAAQAESGGLWQREHGTYSLPHGVLGVQVDAGADYRPEETALRLDKPVQNLEVAMTRWADPARAGWVPFRFYVHADPAAFKGPLDVETLRLVQDASGVRGWAVEHPLALKPPAGSAALELSYEALWELSQRMHGRHRAWIPAERNLFGQCSLDILGSYRPSRPDPGLSDAENLVALALEARNRGALVSLLRPAGTLRVMNRRIHALPLLFFSGPLADVLDLQDKADEDLRLALLKEGIPVPAIRSGRAEPGRGAITADHMVRADEDASQRELLDRLRAGRFNAGDLQLDLALKAQDGTTFSPGDIVPLAGEATVLVPTLRFASRPEPGRAVRQAFVLTNGEVLQPARPMLPVVQGQAQFAGASFRDGDWITARVELDGGATMETNPVYVGPRWRAAKPGGWVRLRLKVVDSRLALVNGAKIAVRSSGAYAEKAAAEGEIELDVSLGAVLTVEAAGFRPATYKVMQRLLARQLRDLPEEASAMRELADLRRLGAGFSDIVQLGEEKAPAAQ